MEHNKEHKEMPKKEGMNMPMPKKAGDMDMAAMHKEMGTEHHASHDEMKKKHEEEMKQHAQKMKKPGHD